jgi:hypothetical protein
MTMKDTRTYGHLRIIFRLVVSFCHRSLIGSAGIFGLSPYGWNSGTPSGIEGGKAGRVSAQEAIPRSSPVLSPAEERRWSEIIIHL